MWVWMEFCSLEGARRIEAEDGHTGTVGHSGIIMACLKCEGNHPQANPAA